MDYLPISVRNRVATYQKRCGDIVCGNSDYAIQFTFDSEWGSVNTKTARFIWNGQYKDVEFSGSVCAVPMLKNTTSVSVGVYAGMLRTTTSAVIGCQKSILCVGAALNEEDARPFISESQKAAERAVAAAEVAEAAAAKNEGGIGFVASETLYIANVGVEGETLIL